MVESRPRGVCERLERRTLLSSAALGQVQFTLDPQSDPVGTIAAELQSLFDGQSTTSSTISFTGSMTAGGQSVSGSFGVSLASSGLSPTFTVGIQNVNTTFDGSAGTILSFQSTGGTGAFLLSQAGIAGQASVQVQSHVSSVDLSGGFELEFNTTASTVTQSVTVNGGTVMLNLPQGPYVRVAATNANLTTKGVTIGGSFLFEAGTDNGERVVKIAADGVHALFGVGDGTADATGVHILSASGGMLLESSGAALDFMGQAELVGMGPLGVNGSLHIKINTLAQDIHEAILIPDPTGSPDKSVQIDVNAGQVAVTGSATLSLQNFASFTGTFGFQRTITTDPAQPGVSDTEFDIGATGITAFVGTGQNTPGALGVQIDQADLGLAVLKHIDTATPANTTPAGYALSTHTGTITLVGLPGLNLSGSLTVNVNKTGGPIKRDIPAGDGNTVSFDFANDLQEVDGSITFQVLDSNSQPVVSVGGTVAVTYDSPTSLLTAQFDPVTVAVYVSGSQIASLTGKIAFTIGGGQGFKLVPKSFQITDFSFFGVGPQAAFSAQTDASTFLSAAADAAKTTTIGPLKMSGLAPSISDLHFDGTTLTVNLGLSADSATLAFGGTNGEGGVTTSITGDPGTPGISGSFGLAVGVDPTTFKVTSFAGTGAFSLSVVHFQLDVANVLTATADNISINYDPNASRSATIATIDTAQVSLPKFKLQGSISPVMVNGQTIPGLTIYGDGFQLGKARIAYIGDTFSIGSAIQITHPFVAITNFGARFSGGNVTFSSDQSISLGAEAAAIGKGSFQFKGQNLTATLAFSGGSPSGFLFTADLLTLELGGHLTLSATTITIDPNATGTQDVASFSSIKADVKISDAFSLHGSAGSMTGNFEIKADGTFVVPMGFSVGLNVGSDSETSQGLAWPSFIPIHITELMLTWNDFTNEPTNFQIALSADVVQSFGPINFSGFVTDVVFDVGKLLAGKFPITHIGDFGISATGHVFGGELGATLAIGTVGVDASGAVLAPGDPTPPADSVFFAGVTGDFKFANLGLKIRFGLSSKGPLEVFVNADTQIVLDPDSGLELVSFFGGITFNATPFPTIEHPSDLRSSIFTPSLQLSDEQWAARLKQETANQIGGGTGFLFRTDVASPFDQTANGPAVSVALRTVFLDHSFSVSQTDPVTVLSPDQTWLIVDPAGEYLVESVNGPYNISRILLHLDANTYAATLDQNGGKAISSDPVLSGLVGAFASAGVVLSANATVKVVTAGSEWQINDGGNIHEVKAKGTALAVYGRGGSMGDLNSVIKIEAGATLSDEYTSPNFMKISGNVILTTDGKFLLNGTLTYFDNLSFNARMYADLSKVQTGAGKIFFLADLPQTPTIASVHGSLTFGFVDENNNPVTVTPTYTPPTTPPAKAFRLTLSGDPNDPTDPGAVTITANKIESIVLDGSAMLTFIVDPAHNRNQIQFDFTTTVSITGGLLTANNVVSATGQFIADFSNSFNVWGAAELTVNSDNIAPLKAAGITVDANVLLKLNTSDSMQSITLTLPGQADTGDKALPATFSLPHNSFGLFIFGAATFTQGPINASLSGAFALDASQAGGFNLLAVASMKVGVQDTPVITFDALGLVIINNDGFAGKLELARSGGISNELSFNAAFKLYINSTGKDQSYTLPPDVVQQFAKAPSTALQQELLQDAFTVPATPPQLPGDTTVEQPGPYVVVMGLGSLTVKNITLAAAQFRIEADLTGFNMQVVADFGLDPFFDLHASGSLRVDNSGAVGGFLITGNLSFGQVTFDGGLTLEVNTTGSPQSIAEYSLQNGQLVTTLVPIGPDTVKLAIQGALKLADSFTLMGSFALTNNDSFLDVAVNANVNAFFGLNLSVNGGAKFFKQSTGDPGLVINLSAGSPGIGIEGVFTLSGNLSLQVNTTQFTPALGVNPQTFVVAVDSPELKLLSVFTLKAGLVRAAYQQGVASLKIQDMTADFFGIGSVAFSGFFNSNGAFDVQCSGKIGLDAKIFSVKGTGSFHITDDTNHDGTPDGLAFEGGATVTGSAFGVDVGTLGLAVHYDSQTGEIVLSGDVYFAGQYVGTLYFSVGSLQFQNPVHIGGSLDQPTAAFTGGLLYLNMGDQRAQYRGFSTNQANEWVNIFGGTFDGISQTLTINLLGQQQTFAGVTGVVADGGSGDDSFFLDPAVQVPVNFAAGSGNNLIIDNSPAYGVFSAGDGSTTIDGGPGPHTIQLGGGSYTINGGGGGDYITINPTGVAGAVTQINEPAGGYLSQLIINGTATPDRFELSSDPGNPADPTAGKVTIGFANADAIRFNHLGQLVVNALQGADTTIIDTTAAPTTVNTVTGDDTLFVLGTASPLTINASEAGSGDTTILVGSPVSGGGRTLAGIAGPVSVVRFNGTSTLLLDDTGDPTPLLSGTLSPSQFVGFGSAPISYTDLSNLILLLGSGGDRLAVTGTSASTNTTLNGGPGPDNFDVLTTSGPTTIDTGGGTNSIRAGSLGNTLTTIQGALTVSGSGSDVLNIADNGEVNPASGILTANALNGLGMGPNGIQFRGIAALNIDLGSGGNTFTVDSTPAGAATVITSGGGNDRVMVRSDAGNTAVKTGGGDDTVAVQTIRGSTSIDTGDGVDAIIVGSNAPNGGGTLSGIQASLVVTGSGNDRLIADDSGDATGQTSTLTQTTLTGLGMPVGIGYSGIEFLDVLLGFGNDTFNVQSTALSTASDALTRIYAGGGVNKINVGSQAPSTGGVLDDIQSGLSIIGSGQDTMNVDDTGSLGAKTGTLTPTTLTGLNMGTLGITYSGLASLNIALGRGATTLPVGNTFTIRDINPLTRTSVDGGPSNNDRINASFAGDFNGRLDLTSFEHGTIGVAGSFNGTLNDTQPGRLESVSIGGSLTATGALLAGSVDAMTIGVDLAGTVLVQQAIANLTVGRNLSGLVTESGTVQNLSIGGSLTQTGSIVAVNSVPTLGNINTLTIGKDFAGSVTVSGTIHTLNIVGGSMAPTARLSVGTVDGITIGPDSLSVGQNLAGAITVAGVLGSIRVAGGTPGTITAGRIGTIAVYGGYGPVVLRVIENGIERRIEAATPANPYPQPDPTATVTGTAYVNTQYFYESGSLANPQLTARITNGVSAAKDQFDFSLVTYNDAAKFNLARLSAVGVAGVRNVAIEGDLLTAVSLQAAAFFKAPSTTASSMIDTTPAGVRLPLDPLAGVAIRDYAPNGFIQARSIQAIAFGAHTCWNGAIEPGARASADDARRLLGAGTATVQANDTFRVPFADLPAYKVGFFFNSGRGWDPFDQSNVQFTVQGLATPNATGTANVIHPSNVARGAVTALITILPAAYRSDESVISTIALRGDGGSIATNQWVSSAITSTGPLGDLTLNSCQGVTNITAPSIFGSILMDGPIVGTIQTTGLRSDPITGATSSVPADLGRLYVVTDGRKTHVTSTVIGSSDSCSEELTGRIISRGNLISQITIDGEISGVIAAQKDLGTTFTIAGKTQRFGGVYSDGPISGQIIVLGNVVGDVNVEGGLRAGRIGVNGSILGNMTVDGGLNSSAAIICVGSIGNATANTLLTINGNNQGIIAAIGSIRFDRVPRGGGSVFANLPANSPNANAIQAAFTPLRFDNSPLDLTGLESIKSKLLSLRIGPQGILTGTGV